MKGIKELLKSILMTTAFLLGNGARQLPKTQRIRIARKVEKMVRTFKDSTAAFIAGAVEEFAYMIFMNDQDIFLTKEIPDLDVKYRVDITEKTQRQIYFYKMYESSLVTFIQKNLRDEISIDIGANVGFYTVLLGTLGKKVLSFEPERKNLEVLRKNIAINNLNENVLLFEGAVGDRSGKTVLHVNPINRGGSSLKKEKYKAGKHVYSNKEIEKRFPEKDLTQEVNIYTIDSVLEGKELEVSFIKIDVEGFELSVLKGMSKLLSGKSVRNIICEVSNMETLAEVEVLMRSYGFKFFRIDFVGERHETDHVFAGNILFSRD